MINNLNKKHHTALMAKSFCNVCVWLIKSRDCFLEMSPLPSLVKHRTIKQGEVRRGRTEEDAPELLWLHKLCFRPQCIRALSPRLPSAAEESVSLDEPSPAFIGPNGTIS